MANGAPIGAPAARATATPQAAQPLAALGLLAGPGGRAVAAGAVGAARLGRTAGAPAGRHRPHPLGGRVAVTFVSVDVGRVVSPRLGGTGGGRPRTQDAALTTSCATTARRPGGTERSGSRCAAPGL